MGRLRSAVRAVGEDAALSRFGAAARVARGAPACGAAARALGAGARRHHPARALPAARARAGGGDYLLLPPGARHARCGELSRGGGGPCRRWAAGVGTLRRLCAPHQPAARAATRLADPADRPVSAPPRAAVGRGRGEPRRHRLALERLRSGARLPARGHDRVPRPGNGRGEPAVRHDARGACPPRRARHPRGGRGRLPRDRPTDADARGDRDRRHLRGPPRRGARPADAAAAQRAGRGEMDARPPGQSLVPDDADPPQAAARPLERGRARRPPERCSP